MQFVVTLRATPWTKYTSLGKIRKEAERKVNTGTNFLKVEG